MSSAMHGPNRAQLDEAKRLLALSPEALYENLGREIGERGLPEDLIRAGRTRFRAIEGKCRSAICKNNTIRVLNTNKTADHIAHVVCAIADTIIHTMGVPVPAMAIAAIIVQSGLDRYCEKFWR